LKRVTSNKLEQGYVNNTENKIHFSDTHYFRFSHPPPEFNLLSINVGMAQSAPSRGIICHDDRFVAVGGCGNILTSTDGEKWTIDRFVTSRTLFSLTYGNNRFVAVGDSGTILTSADGIAWESETTGADYAFNGVVFANGLFIAVGDSGMIYTSADGAAWSKKISRSGDLLYSVAYGKDRFVIAGYNALTMTNVVMTSPDGMQWITHDSLSRAPLFYATYVNNEFIVMDGARNLYVSSDGVDWKTIQTDAPHRLAAISYVNGRFVSVGSDGVVMTAANDSIWTKGQSFTSLNFYNMIYANGKFVAVGANGTIAASSDGMVWTMKSHDSGDSLAAFTAIAFGSKRFVIIGGDVLYSSDNGATWLQSTSPIMEPFAGHGIYSVAYGKNASTDQSGQFVAVGAYGNIFTSPDGAMWKQETTGVSSGLYQALNSVVFDGSQFVAAGWDGTIAASPDGVNWTERSCRKKEKLVSIIHFYDGTNSQFAAIGAARTFFTSSDAITWTSHDSAFPPGDFHSITYGNGRYVALVSGNSIYSSSNGMTWTKIDVGDNVALNAVTYGKASSDGATGKFVAVGYSGAIFVSIDGIQWARLNSYTSRTLDCVAFDGNRFVAAGDNGAIISFTADSATAGITTPKKNALTTNFKAIISNKCISVIVPTVPSVKRYKVNLLTLAGKRLYSSFDRPENGSITLHALKLIPGTYLLSISYENDALCFLSKLIFIR
jgi:hypothetical protein